jgi:type IV pilus assembly protein PilV
MKQPTRIPPSSATPSAARGFSMIETLIALLLLSIGLMGLLGLQARAARMSTDTEDMTRASILANEIASSMWVSTSAATVTPAQISAWNARAADPTSGGMRDGTVSVTTAGKIATITITWRSSSPNSSATDRYVTNVVIP